MFASVTETGTKLLSTFDSRRARDLCVEILGRADIRVGGDRPWDIAVHDERLWARVLRDSSLGFGEAYVDGWWDAPQLDVTIDKLCRAHLRDHVKDSWVLIAHAVKARLLNLQTPTRSFDNGQHHYDIGNDLYEAMLDPRLLYTCAYFDGTDDLDVAQTKKLELVATKIGLRPGMKVLDLGCGWGGFSAFAAERGATVSSYTVSKEQAAYIREKYAHLPIEIHEDDYRNASGQYDAVVSIGLMEHVGPKNYRPYFELVERCLAPGGVGFVHTIGGNKTTAHIEPWFDKYIFPNAVLPTLAAMVSAMQGLFIPEDVHNIGEHYDPTLMAWWKNFDAAWPRLEAKYGRTFYRMWKYYLLSCAGGFRARETQLFQLVFTRMGTPAPRGRRAGDS